MARKSEGASAPPPSITKEQAEKVLAADIANMVKKVANGQTLNSTERAILQTMSDGGRVKGNGGTPPVMAKNKSQLAEILEVSRKTIQRYSKRDDAPEPRPNGTYCVAEWRSYLAKNDVLESDGENADTSVLKARQILLQNRLLEQKIELNDAKVYPVELIEKETVQMIATAKAVLLTGPASLAPQVVGVSIPGAEALLREWIHDALVKLRSNPLGRTDLQEVEDGE